jgi:hypothetical protein
LYCQQHNGGYISDNRMNFLFGTSERGSLDRAFDALQAELDALGVSDGLTRQQVGGRGSRQEGTWPTLATFSFVNASLIFDLRADQNSFVRSRGTGSTSGRTGICCC